MARTPEEEAERANRRDKHDKVRKALRRKTNDIKIWRTSPPSSTNQRDRMADDMAKTILLLCQRVNLLEGGAAVEAEDLVDPD